MFTEDQLSWRFWQTKECQNVRSLRGDLRGEYIYHLPDCMRNWTKESTKIRLNHADLPDVSSTIPPNRCIAILNLKTINVSPLLHPVAYYLCQCSWK